MDNYAEAHPWWVPLVYGILLILLGIFVFIAPVATTVTVVWFIGIYWLIAGIVTLVSLFSNRTKWGWKLVSGVLGVILGAWITFVPFSGAGAGLRTAASVLAVLGALVLLWGIFSIVIGIIDLANAFTGGGWGVGLLGALGIILGIIILANYYAVALISPFVYAGFAIVGGIAAIVVAFRVRSLEHAHHPGMTGTAKPAM